MAITKLKIRFGGICMLWQVAATKKLHVLMPKMQHDGSDTDHMKHCPMMVCNQKYSSNRPSKPPVEHLGGKVVDLSGIGRPGGMQSMKNFARISRYANPGGAPLMVARDCVSGPLPDFMSCRITLPLPQTLAALPGSAEFEVPGQLATVDLFGEAEATFNVEDPTPFQSQFSTPLKGDTTDTLEIGIVNVRVKDLNNPREYKHFKDEPWEHQQSYYWLIDGWGADRRVGRPAILARDVGAVRNKHEHHGHDCIKADPNEWPPPNKFVDPFTCTLGGGCDPDTGAGC